MIAERSTRWSIYLLLIVLAASIMLARIARVRSPDPRSPTPFQSANDRSRWATIRALGDSGTYVIDDIIFDRAGKPIRGWQTIDLVRHRGPDGREHYYSSKPTLLVTLLAGEYWLIKQITGASLAVETFYIARCLLVLTNLVPMAIGLILLARLIEQLGINDWARLFAVAAASFGTFLTTFSITLNNHLVAAISLIAALALAVPIWRENRREWWRFASVGLAVGFLAANEIPAIAFLVIALVGLAIKDWQRTVAAFVPAVAIVAAAALGTNYWAHGDWRTPYAHRSDGPVIGKLADSLEADLNASIPTEEFVNSLREQKIEISAYPKIEQRQRGERWVLWDEKTQTRLALIRTPAGDPAEIQVRAWDNWYDYEGSYWMPHKLRGTDRGEPSRLVYAFNVLIGHHGLFSLTPLWVLSMIGCAWSLRRGDSTGRMLALATVLVTIVVVGFYLSRPQIDRNYGGTTCCLRWLIWLSPLWLLTMLPAADWLSRSWQGRTIALFCLGLSVFSAFYAADNPWSHPWLFDYWTAMGWINY